MAITKQITPILTEAQIEYGFTLVEDYPDFVCLKLGTFVTAVFGQRTTAGEIQKEANNQIKIITAYQTTDRFIADAYEKCRDDGWSEPK